MGQNGFGLGADSLIGLLRNGREAPKKELIWALESISGLTLGDDPDGWAAWWEGVPEEAKCLPHTPPEPIRITEPNPSQSTGAARIERTAAAVSLVELDHVFVCCAVGAPEALLLVQRGLLEGSPNNHAGQGTANRRFFFSNAYLELLWVSDPAEAQREVVLPTQLWERWSRRTEGACPFGIVFRPRTVATAETPFSTWSYRPPYLPDGLSIDVGRDMALTEPQLFYLPFARHRHFTESRTNHSSGRY